MPDTHNTKNFFAHGGNELVIGGKLTILEGAEVTGLGEGTEPFTPMPNQPASAASTIATLKEDFNTLLTALKTAGLMVADTPAGGDDEEEDDPEPEEGDDEEVNPENPPENENGDA